MKKVFTGYKLVPHLSCPAKIARHIRLLQKLYQSPASCRDYGPRKMAFIQDSLHYRIFLAIRRGFRPSRMTSNNLISPIKFCYNTNSTLPKQCQSSRSVLQDGSRTFGLFWKEKTLSYNRRNTVLCFLLSLGMKQNLGDRPDRKSFIMYNRAEAKFDSLSRK